MQGLLSWGGRWGSNGEAEARIPLKINIYFILATHNNTPSYKQKQSAEGAFLVEELSAARRRKAHTTKKRKVKPCVAFGVEDGIRTHDKKSSYSTHYQQVATATKEYISKGLQVRAQLLLFEQRYTKIRK